MTWRALVLVLVLVAAPAAAEPVPPGTRVRVTLATDALGHDPGDRLVGALGRLTPERFEFADGRDLPWPAIAELEVSVRRESNAGRGAKYGFVIGAAAGVIAGVLVGKEIDDRDSGVQQFAA